MLNLRVFICVCAVAVSGLHALQLEATVRGRMPFDLVSTSGFYDNNGSIIVAGGLYGFGGISTLWKYDLESEKVKAAGDFPYAVWGGGIGSGGNGSHYYFGGKMTSDPFYDVISTICRIDSSETGSIRVYPEYIGMSQKMPQSAEMIRPIPVGDLPTPVVYQGTSDDGQGNIYITGGESAEEDSRDIVRYNPNSNSVQVVAQLPTTRTGVATAFVKGGLYVFGGDRSSENDIYRYDVETGEIRSVGTLPAHAYSTAVAVGNDIYVVGGRGDGVGPFRMFRFDTVNEKLETVEVLNLTQNVSFACVVYVEHLHRIYILGGTYEDEYIYSIQLL